MPGLGGEHGRRRRRPRTQRTHEGATREASTESPSGARRRWAAGLAALFVTAALAAVAYADNIAVDGDTTVSPPNITYTVSGSGNSHACSTRGAGVPGLATINFQGSSHFTAGETVTVTATPNAAAIAAGITAVGGTATVPTPWTSAGTFTRAMTTTVPATAGDGDYTITVTASGSITLPDRTYDVRIECASPTVTINQATGQADPTKNSPINFTVAFSETVSGFTASDISFTGSTAAGALVATVSGSGPIYNVAVSGMTGTGLVVASIPANGVTDATGNANSASTSTDNSVLYDVTAPTVTIDQKSGQDDPTTASPIEFTADFSESVTGFADVDVSLSGTAGATTAVVTGGPMTYNVAVSGMTASGTVIATIPANAATDAATNGNSASTSTDNTVTFISNSTPIVTANDDTFSEGTSKTYSATWTDAGGGGQTHTCTIDFGDGGGPVAGTVSAQPSASGTCSASHTYGDGPNTHMIEVSVTDGIATGSDTATAAVTNVVPTIALSGDASVNEGASYSLTLGAITDPGTDTVTEWIVHWGDGSPAETFTSGGIKTHTYADGPTSPTITVDLEDEDGTHLAAGTTTITVNNVVPTIALSGDVSVNEGASYSLTLGAITDPGTDTVTEWIVHWGDGSPAETFTSGGIKTHTYADGPTSPTITVDLEDEDGTHLAAGTKTITVNNVVPTIALSGDASVNEGASYSLTLGAITDPGTDTVTEWIVHWGDGSPAETFTSGGIKTHTYADGPTSPTITVDLEDEDGTHLAAGTKTITVNNVVPTIALSGDASVNEGASYSLTLGAITDPGTDTVTEWIVHWGDGSPAETFTSGGIKTHTYADGPTSPTITVDLEDEDGTHLAAGTKTITVNNVAPVIGTFTCPVDPIAVNMPVTLNGAFADAGTADTHTATIAWDDGSTTSASVNQSADSVSGSHTYSSAGIYTPELTVTDDGGGTSSPKTCEYVVIYDPSAGFVTGGGWINSPAGAYIANPSMVGKANFGFVSKYQKGANVPSGNTEFQFHAASLNFKSTSYQWLVVAGSKGTYKGSGTINGGGNYGFLLSAIDGSPDRVRIKIWNKADADTIVYDNLVGGGSDDADPTTTLGGGSIVIHKGK